MRSSIFIICITGLFLNSAIPSDARNPDTAKKPEELIKELANPDFAVREAAQKELNRLGSNAIETIRGGLQSEDPEVKRRCAQLIAQIEEAEWAQKAGDYLADRDGKRSRSLPLVKEFENVAGTEQNARKLFAEALRTNGAFLQSVVDSKDHGREAYEARCRALFIPKKLRSETAKIKAGDLASVLLVSTFVKNSGTWKDPANVSHLLGNPGLNEAIKDKETGKAMSGLLLRWADNQAVDDVQVLQYFLCFVHANNFEEGLKIARNLIRDKDASPLNLRALAVAVLDKVGGKDSAKELGKLLDDENQLVTPKVGCKACICDQALGASIRKSGKEPKDYKLNEMPVRLKAPGDTVMVITLYWFATDDERKDNIKKWKDAAGNGE